MVHRGLKVKSAINQKSAFYEVANSSVRCKLVNEYILVENVRMNFFFKQQKNVNF